LEIFEAAELTCKPNSVPAPPKGAGGDHSSGRRITAPLERPTRKRPALRAHPKFSPFKPRIWNPRATRSGPDQPWFRLPIWSCTAGGLPSRTCRHARWWCLYLTVSPSPVALLRGLKFRVPNLRFETAQQRA